MSNKVTIKIIGQQTLGAEKDETIVCAEGIYDKKNVMHCIEYDETPEVGVHIHNKISASERGVKITKSGAVSSDMLFIPGKSKEVAYKTPYGTFSMETRCKAVEIKEAEDTIRIYVEYGLYTSGELMSDCVTEIDIQMN